MYHKDIVVGTYQAGAVNPNFKFELGAFRSPQFLFQVVEMIAPFKYLIIRPGRRIR